MKKNIKILLSFVLAFVIIVGIFYFYQKQKNKENRNIQKTKNEFCYRLEKDSKKREIKFKEKKIKDVVVVEGEDIYSAYKEKKQDFVFSGILKDGKFLIVFGKNKDDQGNNFYERRYKKYVNGILEGAVEQNNYEKKIIEGKNFFYIKDKNKIKYDGKLAIFKVSCK